MKLKISRLFHWLYATLMFLPILMFLPACLYFAFNEHATNETTTEINYKYQSNQINTLDDLVVNNIYFMEEMYFDSSELYGNSPYLQILKVDSIDFDTNDDFFIEEIYVDSYDSNLHNNLYIQFDIDFLSVYFTNDDNYCNVNTNNYNSVTLYNSVFLLNDDFLTFSTISHFFENNLPQYTDYNVIESVTTNVEQTIPQQINNAWNSVWNLPVFSWTQNSFITAPFSYITALFGLGSDNSLNYVFTYFASISICWLVFDLIMYVPNLAHRWLDRSAIE